MNRWTSIFGALLLVLMLWTGGAAHAAERFDCIPATAAEAAGHFDGDQDQVPSGPDQGVAHHHAGCGGHHEAAPANVAAVELALSQDLVPFAWRESGRPGRGPDSDLRPPIA